MKKASKERPAGIGPELTALVACLDEMKGRYEALKQVSGFGEYVVASTKAADEQTLTEPLLQRIVERVLGFPADAYFPQLGKSGLKPDLTPKDLIAHSFVLDAKGTDESLAQHVAQIRGYVDQRSLRHGVLFNLKEIRVYPRGQERHDPSLSFKLLPLWQAAHGEMMPGPEVAAFERFVKQFRHRDISVAGKIEHIRRQESWADRLAAGEAVEVDVEWLVDQLRALAGELTGDAAVQQDELDEFLADDPARERRLLDELKQLALDVEPGVDVDTLPASVSAWRLAPGLADRVWRQYLLRVAYLVLTRILLYRAWEDVQFVDEQLYDGGFDRAYERLDENVRSVLRRAFTLGAERYRTLFAAENTYEWYRPSEPVLVEVLYRLGPVPLGKLDQDALGALYVSYVDEIDRDRLGQFFTPRDVVRFMLDRAGFAGENVFRIEGDERKPLRVFDFATGSGGFLVEAARRVIDDAGIAADDRKGLREALRAISTGFYGGEISPFPYYLTEINLLLQVSRLLGRMRLAGVDPPPFVLGVVRADSLATRSGTQRVDLPEDDIYSPIPVEPEKRDRYRDLTEDGSFDLVIGNPPYVAEPNNRPLFRHLRSIPAWKGTYRGKTDYLYYFLLLALEKLKPGGRLCVITPAAWMNAGSADFLRERLAAGLTLEELYLFGGYRVFAADQGPAPTPTVESAILVATKAPAPKGHKLRVVILDDEASGAAGGRAALLDEMGKRIGGRAGTRSGLKAHTVPQSELRAEYPWPVKFGASDVPTRVVAHLQRVLARDGPVESLETSWYVFQGIQTGADAYTRRIDRRLSAEDRAALVGRGVRLGDAVLELPAALAAAAPWTDHAAVLGKNPEPRGILYGAIDNDFTYLVVLRGDSTPPREIIDALEKFRPLLATRAEIARNHRRRWWETAWPRSASKLAAPKVIALYRTDRGRFALDETGEWQPSIKSTIVVGKEADAPVAFLCGLLNSELLDLWTAVRGKTPWHVRRNYEPKRMNEIPYRRPEGDSRADEVAERVRAIAANRRALLPLRPLIADLGRTIKDPWRTGPVVADRHAIVASLPPKQLVSVRTDSSLTADVVEVPMGSPKRFDEETLAFRRGRIETGRVTGPRERLDLLKELVGARADDVSDVLLPRDVDALAAAEADAVGRATALLEEGRQLVEEVERLVCGLYDVPSDLTEAVVEHALARAGRSLPAEG